jgi:hypothetical protein
MHVRSSGDPVEITGERDSLTINCEISECTHATTHTVDVPMRNAQPRKEGFEFIAGFFHQQGLRRGGRLSGGSKLAHAFVNFCMTV